MQSKTRLAIVLFLFVGWMSYHDFVSFAGTEDPAHVQQGPALTDDQRQFFESKIRPVLVKSCYQCHSAKAKEVEGNLLLDSRAGLRQGGADGPVIVAGNADASILIQALRYANKDLAMPPKDGGGKLPDSVIRDFETWVKMGAPDPRDGAAAPAPKTFDTKEAKKWWAFQPLHRAMSPMVMDAGWTRGEIDQYVRGALEAKNIKPVADADRQTLIRRVYFDLIGLPPTPAEVDAFVRDGSPAAYEKMVDDLLARPQFGEHWGRHWLDVARYAESSGKDFNVTFPSAWRYRDYVIAAFNQDKPYDQFIREQIAGDLMPALDDKTRANHLIATGFLAVGPKGLDEQIPRQFDLDLADEQVDATSEAFMALTVSCARCHDHKFDPILQRDYYAMAGIFLSTKTAYGTVAGLKNSHGSELIALPADADLPNVPKFLSSEQRQQLEKELEDVTSQLNALLPSRANRAARRAARQNKSEEGGNGVAQFAQLRQLVGRKAQLENELNSFDQSGHLKAFCMGVQDRPVSYGRLPPMEAIRLGPNGNPARRQSSGFETIGDSPLFFRGEMSDPRDRVPRGVPGVFGLEPAAGNPRRSKRPPGACGLDRIAEQSADGAGDGQSNLVVALRAGDRWRRSITLERWERCRPISSCSIIWQFN